MRIIITGAAGFIGSNLTLRLLSQGHEVVGVDNLSYGHERNVAKAFDFKHFRFIKADVLDSEFEFPEQADVLVHLASKKIPRYTHALSTLNDNSSMLRKVLEYCLRTNAKLVFASTSDVYGKNPNVPFSEDSDLVMGPTTIKRWAYALSKIYGEHLILAHHDNSGLNFAIARFFGSYGPHQHLSWWGGPQSVFIEAALKKQPIEIHGNGLQTRTFTYVDDTISGLLPLVTNEKSNGQIFNIGAGADQEISIIDLAKLIWQLVNGENAEPFLRFVPYSQFGRYEDVERRLPDISKLQQFFNFQPQWTLEKGLAFTIEWQKTVMAE